MQTLTCPIPSNINPLQSNGFLFGIQKLPQISFFCQEINVPELMLPLAEAATSLVNSRLPGDKPMFGDLTVNFLIDETMSNFVAIYDWMSGLGFPENSQQYADLMAERTDALNRNFYAASVSDATLQILGSSNNPVRTIRFIDTFPTSLSSLTLTSTGGDTQYLVGVATFGYTYYKFE
jgi:hypothetical protein